MQRNDVVRALVPLILEPFGQEQLLSCYQHFQSQLMPYIKGWRPKQAPRERLLHGIAHVTPKTPLVLTFFGSAWLDMDEDGAQALMDATNEIQEQAAKYLEAKENGDIADSNPAMEQVIQEDGSIRTAGLANPSFPQIRAYIESQGLLAYVRNVVFNPSFGLKGLLSYYPSAKDLQGLHDALLQGKPDAGEGEPSEQGQSVGVAVAVQSETAAEAVGTNHDAELVELELQLAEQVAVRDRYVAEVETLTQDLRKLQNKVMEAEAKAEARQREVAKLKQVQKSNRAMERQLAEQQSIFEKMQEEVQRIARRNDELTVAIEGFDAQVEQKRQLLLADIQKANDERDHAMAERDAVIAERDQARQERLAAIRERDEMKVREKELNARIVTLSNEVSALKKQIEMLRKQKGSDDSAQLRQRIQDLEEALASKPAGNPDLERELQEQKAYNHDLLRMMAGLEAERDDLRQKVQQYKGELEQMRARAPGNDEIDMDSLRNLVG